MLRIQLGVRRKSTQLNLVPSFIPRAARKGNFKGSGLTRKQYKQAQATAARDKARASAKARAKAKATNSGPKSKKFMDEMQKIKTSELESMEPSSKVSTAISTAKKMELSHAGTLHALAPWLNAAGSLTYNYLTSKKTSKKTNKVVDGTDIGFSNDTTTYSYHCHLGDSRKMPKSRNAIINKIPLYDSTWRDGADMTGGIYKAPCAQPMKAGLGLTTSRFFGHPLPERQLRRLRTSTSSFRTQPFSCIGSGASTQFDADVTAHAQNTVYNPMWTKDTFKIVNLNRLTSCKVDFHIVQLNYPKDDNTLNPYNAATHIEANIPDVFRPTESGHSGHTTLKKYVQGTTHKGFGQVHDTSLGAIEWETLQNYSVKRDSKASETFNYVKSMSQVLKPGDCVNFEISEYKNIDITQRAGINQYPNSEDQSRDSYCVLISLNGEDINAYNAKAGSGTGENWEVASRTYVRRNATADASVRREIEYNDYSFKDVGNADQDPTNAANLFYSSYRAQPEKVDVHKSVYALYEDVVSEESEAEIPANSSNKFLIPDRKSVV